jgi:hypothetical protein
VRTPAGASIPIQANLGDSVQMLKVKVEQREGIPVSQQEIDEEGDNVFECLLSFVSFF